MVVLPDRAFSESLSLSLSLFYSTERDSFSHLYIVNILSSKPAGIDMSASTLHSLHRLLTRWCGQMLAPPHSLHVLPRRWCGQMLVPAHSLDRLRWCWCGQMLAPPHSLHEILMRRCRSSAGRCSP